jgi:hypothetical protein
MVPDVDRDMDTDKDKEMETWTRTQTVTLGHGAGTHGRDMGQKGGQGCGAGTRRMDPGHGLRAWSKTGSPGGYRYQIYGKEYT